MTEIVHIVDDDPSIRAATSYLLSNHGYSTRIYASGQEFLREVDSQDGCALLDLRMPEMSGLDVLEELARRSIGLPVIMVTGHGDVMAAVRALKLGAVDLIQKPYQEAELFDALERAFAVSERDRRQREAKRTACERLKRLSERETQVLRGLLAGLTNKQMARRLGLSPRTVEMHRSNMMSDLRVSAAADAIRIAIDGELTPLEPESALAAPVPSVPLPRPPAVPAAAPAWSAPTQLAEISALDVLEGSTDGILLLDPQLNITYANGEAAETIGEGRNLAGQSLWLAFPGARHSPAGEQIRRAAELRTAACFDLYSPGLSRWFNVKLRPIPSGLQLSFRPLTAKGQLMLL